MKRNFKKYLITILSLLLILSNFSFATTYLYCSMKQETKQTCPQCVVEKNKKSDVVSINRVKKSCCDSRTSEINNSNILNTVKSETNHNNLSMIGFIVNDDFNTCFTGSKCVSLYTSLLHQQIPKTDIPIATSSLLI